MTKKPTAPANADILSYRHPDRRKNNPEVGMVTPATDPDEGKTRWQHDPHLDPTLSWTGKAERIRAELDEDALEAFHGTVSLPFAAGDNRKVAVKIVDGRGIESLRIVNLED